MGQSIRCIYIFGQNVSDMGQCNPYICYTIPDIGPNNSNAGQPIWAKVIFICVSLFTHIYIYIYIYITFCVLYIWDNILEKKEKII